MSRVASFLSSATTIVDGQDMAILLLLLILGAFAVVELRQPRTRWWFVLCCSIGCSLLPFALIGYLAGPMYALGAVCVLVLVCVGLPVAALLMQGGWAQWKDYRRTHQPHAGHHWSRVQNQNNVMGLKDQNRRWNFNDQNHHQSQSLYQKYQLDLSFSFSSIQSIMARGIMAFLNDFPQRPMFNLVIFFFAVMPILSLGRLFYEWGGPSWAVFGSGVGALFSAGSCYYAIFKMQPVDSNYVVTNIIPTRPRGGAPSTVK